MQGVSYYTFMEVLILCSTNCLQIKLGQIETHVKIPFILNPVYVNLCVSTPVTIYFSAKKNVLCVYQSVTTLRPGASFTSGFLPAIQIRWKLRLAITPLLAIRSQQIFAHATTAQLSCHVKHFVAITVLESRWEWNEISIEFELRWKNR